MTSIDRNTSLDKMNVNITPLGSKENTQDNTQTLITRWSNKNQIINFGDALKLLCPSDSSGTPKTTFPDRALERFKDIYEANKSDPAKLRTLVEAIDDFFSSPLDAFSKKVNDEVLNRPESREFKKMMLMVLAFYYHEQATKGSTGTIEQKDIEKKILYFRLAMHYFEKAKKLSGQSGSDLDKIKDSKGTVITAFSFADRITKNYADALLEYAGSLRGQTKGAATESKSDDITVLGKRRAAAQWLADVLAMDPAMAKKNTAFHDHLAKEYINIANLILFQKNSGAVHKAMREEKIELQFNDEPNNYKEEYMVESFNDAAMFKQNTKESNTKPFMLARAYLDKAQTINEDTKHYRAILDLAELLAGYRASKKPIYNQEFLDDKIKKLHSSLQLNILTKEERKIVIKQANMDNDNNYNKARKIVIKEGDKIKDKYYNNALYTIDLNKSTSNNGKVTPGIAVLIVLCVIDEAIKCSYAGEKVNESAYAGNWNKNIVDYFKSLKDTDYIDCPDYNLHELVDWLLLGTKESFRPYIRNDQTGH